MTPEEIAQQVRAAVESGDLAAYREVLAPDVTWGPPDVGCRNRDQVISWYQRAHDAGVRAQVTEVTVHDDKILVGLMVEGTPNAQERGGHAPRWQVLTLRQGRVADISGFEDRAEAAAQVGL
jgi:ketosteroid isomerase-like protein